GTDYYGIQDTRGCTDQTAGFTEPPCIRYKSNQWMEFTVRIEVRGTSNAPQSRVQLWVNGQLALDYPSAKIAWGSSEGDGIGQVMLTPYHTRKDPAQTHPVGYTWYDDVIVSTQPIAMANGSTPPPSSDTTPPTVSITVPTSGSPVSGTSVNVSATASDNTGVAGVQFTLDGANLGTELTAGPWAVQWNTLTAINGAHTLTAVVRDAAGNTATASPVTVQVSNAPGSVISAFVQTAGLSNNGGGG